MQLLPRADTGAGISATLCASALMLLAVAAAFARKTRCCVAPIACTPLHVLLHLLLPCAAATSAAAAGAPVAMLPHTSPVGLLSERTTSCTPFGFSLYASKKWMMSS
jgi:hypothetical protein